MGLEGRQSEMAAMPTGGEHPPCVRDGSALWHEVTMDEALDVSETVRSILTFVGDDCLKSLGSSEGILR